ncbi:MAG: MATE family efflux transporter [Oscillospiraceae bacterium]|nr:MATE family efflux transporter [Oscillospiraceae bacterium]
MVKDKNFYRSLLIVAVPAAFQSLISLSVSMLDNIMVGSLGDVSLAAVSLANQATALLTFIINGLAGGSAVLVSQYWGKKDLVHTREIFGVILRFAFLVLAAVSALMFIFPQAVMRIFTTDQDMIAEGAKYVRIACLSYIFFGLANSIVAMLRWIKVVKVGLLISTISLFTNLIFNYVLIFGKLGLPAMGIQGAALATVLARMVEFGIAVYYLFYKETQLKMRLKDVLTRNKEMFSDFVKHSLPIVFGDLQWGIVGTVKVMMIGRLGVTMTSANAIADVVLSLAMVFTNGLTQGACVVIGNSVGAKEYDKTRQYSNTIQVMFAAIGVCVAALVFFTRGIPPTFYNVSDETKALASTMLAIGAFTHIGTCYHAACFVGINRGAGDGNFVVKVDLICGWLVVLPLTFLAGFVLKLPLPVVYLCTRIDQCFKWLIAFIRLRGDKWIKNVTRD